MKTYAFCPISENRIDERVARSNALFTVAILTAFAISLNVLLVLFLATDFLLRATSNSKYSLLGRASKVVVKYVAANQRFANAGPKIFAARIGFVLSSLIVLATVFGLPLIVYSLTAILGLFSFLEGAFGFCVACKIYPLVYKIFYRGNT